MATDATKGAYLHGVVLGSPNITPFLQNTNYMVAEALNILDASNMPQIAALMKKCEEEFEGTLTMDAFN